MAEADLHPAAEGDLHRLGVALRLKLISPSQLVAVLSEWAADPGRDLRAMCREQGLLDDRRLLLIDAGAAAAEAGGTICDAEGTAVCDGPAPPPAESLSVPAGADVGAGGSGHDSLASFGGAASLRITRDGPALLGTIDDRANITQEHPGRYTIKGEHGRGGIGRVLLAFDEHVGREVALKELLPERAGGGSFGTPGSRSVAAMARFLREARITGQLEHPGIVPVYEIARRRDGSIFYTMKMVRGRTLKDKLKECANLTDRLHLLPHFLDLCQAMAYAHSRGVVHRDLKPANVMVGEFGETVVLDWGLAKVRGLADVRAGALERGLALFKDATADTTVAGQPLGTPAYMSPEQAEGRIDDIDERSDVWGLGAVLYQLLTGRPPFIADTVYEIVEKVIREPLTPAGALEPKAPPELVSIAARCLAKDRDGRYPHAGELAADLTRFTSGGLVSAYEYSMWAIAAKWLRRYRAIVVTAGVGLVALAVLGLWAVYNINAERKHALDQKELALAHKAAAEKNEQRALLNLAEAFVQKGQVLEEKNLNNEARVYYANALIIKDDPKARSGIYRELTNPLRTRLDWMWQDPAPHVRALAVSRDGARIAASACVDKASDQFCARSRIDIMDVAGRRPVATIESEGDLSRGLAFSPDGSRLASCFCARPEGSLCREEAVRVWEAGSGKLVAERRLRVSLSKGLAVSPSGRLAVSGCASRVEGSATDCSLGGVELISLDGHTPEALLRGHGDYIQAAAFTPDERGLLTAGHDRNVGVWDLDTGKPVRMLSGHPAYVFAVAVSADGKTAASGDDLNHIYIWDLATGARRADLTGHADSVWALAFSPDGRTLASGSDDFTVRLWSLESMSALRTLTGYSANVRTVALSPDGKRLFTADLNGLHRVWELEPGREVQVLAGHEDLVRCVKVSSDGRWIVSAAEDRTLRWWRASDGAPERTVATGKVSALALAPDASLAAVGAADGNIILYRLEDGATVGTWEAHAQSVRDLSFASDGKRLASAGEDGAVKLWSVPEGALIKSLQEGAYRVYTVAFAPDGRLASGGADRKLHLWDPGSGRELVAPMALPGEVRVARFNPAGTLLAVGLSDGGVTLLESGRLTKVRDLAGHAAIVLSLDFSPDGAYLVSAGGDRDLRLWRVEDGEQLYFMSGHRFYTYTVALAPDGKDVVSGSGDKTVRRWPVLPEVFTATPAQHLAAAVRETGLKIEGFNITAWDPFAGREQKIEP
jgi:eukaryotic-like serine/threonine-protein kinase